MSRIKNIIIIIKLLKELKKYKDIFLIKKVNRLSFYKKYNYIIKIITKSLFNLLYNLFNIKLTKLRRYLNDILIKIKFNILRV